MSHYVFDNDSEIKRSRYKPIFKAVDLSVDYIKKHLHESICISDIATVVNLSESRYEALREAMIKAFENKFPSKSRFEK